MDEHNYHIDPWDRDSYETGSTHPPKSRSGMIAVLLVLVILLGGMVSVLGILNIRLSAQLNQSPDPTGPIIFSPVESTCADAAPSSTAPPTHAPITGDVQLELEDAPQGVENIPQEGGLSLQAIYDQAIDSVVSITCATEDGSSSGTGVVLSADGYIITNCHVVDDATAIEIRFTGGQRHNARIVGADAVSDIAVLKVDATGLIPARFGNSATLRVGDAVAAIGDPLGAEFRGTLTDGIVSAINREVRVGGRTMTLIQTNAALNSGNSGGPLLNCYGQVIGINTMKISAFVDAAGVEGIGFAIPSAAVKEVVDQLITKGFVAGRPSIGIVGETVSATYRHFYGLPAGFLVTEVDDESAAAALLQPGDIVLSFGGSRITGSSDLEQALYRCDAGDTVEIILYRNRQQLTVSLTLDEAGK